jgi:hypothetical protein
MPFSDPNHPLWKRKTCAGPSTRSVSGQLGGTITYDWSEKGVVVVLKLSGEKLAK